MLTMIFIIIVLSKASVGMVDGHSTKLKISQQYPVKKSPLFSLILSPVHHYLLITRYTK